MAKVLLFDLDGTLLPMNTDEFVQGYLKVLAKEVSPHIDPEFFIKALWKATQDMIENKDPEKTNEEVFEQSFIALTGVDRDSFWPLFDQFYKETFPSLSYLSKKDPLAQKIVEEALEQGYQIGIATNPVFPRAAIEHRMNWAGILDMPFEVVTVYEECSFTKPHKEYYQMISEKIGVKPEECIMIGNDVQEDLAASRIGMKTFLVEGYVIDRGEPAYIADDQGTLEQLYNRLKSKEGIFA